VTDKPPAKSGKTTDNTPEGPETPESPANPATPDAPDTPETEETPDALVTNATGTPLLPGEELPPMMREGMPFAAQVESRRAGQPDPSARNEGRV
jgi:hypothetical protein